MSEAKNRGTSEATEVVEDLLKTAEEYMGEFESPMDRGVCYAMLVHLRKRAYTLGFLRPNSDQDSDWSATKCNIIGCGWQTLPEAASLHPYGCPRHLRLDPPDAGRARVGGSDRVDGSVESPPFVSPAGEACAARGFARANDPRSTSATGGACGASCGHPVTPHSADCPRQGEVWTDGHFALRASDATDVHAPCPRSECDHGREPSTAASCAWCDRPLCGECGCPLPDRPADAKNDAELDSPNFVPQAAKDLAARGFERVNVPAKDASPTEELRLLGIEMASHIAAIDSSSSAVAEYIAARMARRPDYAPARGTMCCLICGSGEPHPHGRDEVEAWATNQVSRWGYIAFLSPRNITDPVIDRALKRLEDDAHFKGVGPTTWLTEREAKEIAALIRSAQKRSDGQ